MIFHCIVQILKNDIVDIRSQMTYRCIQKVQLVLQAEFLELGSCCGIKLSSLTTVFHVDIINVFHQLDCLALADMLIQSSAKIIGNIIFSVRKRTCTAETAHNRTSLTVDTVLYLFAIDWALSFLKGITLFKNCYFAVRFFFHQFICCKNPSRTCTDNNHIIVHALSSSTSKKSLLFSLSLFRAYKEQKELFFYKILFTFYVSLL